ncbi:Solute carrier 2 (Facilitated glucose transporter) member 8 [Desmophyllum pertusum]|uniref:Solute carrier 2 (Facilitated glucose transporter) member 8 n=1 Tax=Desmophyllum pertusum TaxID=174260 RepID=A0A9W9ZDQ7_9CNID|nr:Solute carrier 2 (Facilitated glucose transporter) member 8 [Desmophyllum pertusum]
MYHRRKDSRPDWRKFSIIVGAIPLGLGWLLLFFAKNRLMLYSGRIITGLGCGIETVAVAVYIAEISPAHLRGMLGSVNQLAVTLGIILAYLAGYFFYWDWVALLGCVPPALLFILMFWMPESPRWYLGKKRKNDALKSLLWLRGSQTGIEDECREMQAALDRHGQIECQEFFTVPVAKPVLISVGVLSLQQLCGMNAVLFNAADIFSKAGLSNPKLASFPVSIVQLVGTLMACFLVDRIGRRVLLWTNALGMATSLIGLGVYFEIYKTTEAISWLSILTAVFVFFLLFPGMGPSSLGRHGRVHPTQSPRSGHQRGRFD